MHGAGNGPPADVPAAQWNMWIFYWENNPWKLSCAKRYLLWGDSLHQWIITGESRSLWSISCNLHPWIGTPTNIFKEPVTKFGTNYQGEVEGIRIALEQTQSLADLQPLGSKHLATNIRCRTLDKHIKDKGISCKIKLAMWSHRSKTKWTSWWGSTRSGKYCR